MKKTKIYYEDKALIYSLNLSRYSGHYKILKFIEALNKKPLTILDVGCATGYFGAKLKEMGHKVYGVEISEKAGLEAKKLLDDVIIGDIEEIDLPYPERYFDVIICADVLEHLFNPKDVIIKLKRYLKHDGYLIASIPNVANWKIRFDLLKGKFEYSEVGPLDFGHIRFFTYYTAKRMFEEAGYKIEMVDFNINIADFPRVLRLTIWAINKIKLTSKLWQRLTRRYINFFGYQMIFVAAKV
ncbi:class I SAM-dependent methyltransferase [Thermococcus sp. LS2]|uniref:class I SAM-dependent methyltransferase n=1 Tax=Thermococcus sp. LS2 TaxID=1638260 RepID=UPI001439E153|nr:class I SAM-dependent methyltransferase [Thermococcus sp. LS2]NJE12847.1 SAM-dependent methyltransferase [Thermococcus sp. LS2]